MNAVELDSQQKLAVQTSSPHVLCLAGAGSGKTRVLTERIAYLIEQKKVSPFEILAITFTRKAAQEMRERIENRIGPRAHHINVGTIHSRALSFLRRFGEMVGLRGKCLTVYSEWEENYLLREEAIDLGLYNSIATGRAWKIPKKTIDRIFATYYQEGIEPPEEDPAYPLFKGFIFRCKENNAITYGGLLIALKVLIPMIQEYLQFRHVLVDEVQDIDPLQWGIVNLLIEKCRADLFVVGDCDQSIYEWRGAVPQYLLDHQDAFDIYRIENNYRSDPRIVEAANRLIEVNQKRLPKTMRATRSHQVGIAALREMDSSALARWIRAWGDPNLNDQNTAIAVLARTHVLLDKLSGELELVGVPHTRIGKTHRLMNTEDFRRFHAFLKLLVNPFDNFSLLLIRDLLSISRAQYTAIRLEAIQQGKSHFQIWMASAHPNLQSAFFREYLAEGQSLVRTVMTLGSQYTGTSDSMQFALDWIRENPNGTLPEYLDYVALYDIQDEIQEADKDLKLMTVHASKGLEWPTVIVAGVNEGILPSKQAIDSDEIEQERRLMYVAMTRAQDGLVLAVRPERTEGASGRVYENPPSRFLCEI